VLGTIGWSFVSAQLVGPAFCRPKELQPSPQHNSFAAGKIGSRCALPLSYSDSHRWRNSNPQPLSEVTRACTTPQLFQILSFFLTSLLPSLFTSSFQHTSSVSFSTCIFRVRNSGRNRRSRSFGFRTRSLSAVSTRSIRELHHPGNSSPAEDALESKRFRRLDLDSRENASRETGSPCHRIVLAFVFWSHSLPLHAQ
jgi:hypothetical protein